MPWDFGAACHGGTFDWSFSQGKYKNILHANSLSEGGICEALSVSWIAALCQGSSLQKNLTWNGKVDASRVATVAQRFVTDYKTKDGKMMGGSEQRSASRKYLESLGLKGFPYSDQKRDMKSQFYAVFEILKKCKVYKQNNAIYSLIGMQGKDWGHGLAYAVAENKVTKFFDPNKGEFTFPSYEKFISWFKLYQKANLKLYAWITSLQTNGFYRPKS